ncbi:hypothetical protein OnM2_069047 [Erysiphe neolycopersici]|uniref:Uncharacterized protein n=1 Tax=Erysiphe neolycopersici TaxID=212602 RepID=A0A420HLB5_9PEZI|nr:hypothetical protein OnM2_069047 [Erysiphe neolycopersici]
MKLGECSIEHMIKAVERNNPEGPSNIVHRQGRQNFLHNTWKEDLDDIPGMRRRVRMSAINLYFRST